MKILKKTLLTSLVIFVFQLAIQAQVSGSISGTVTDESEAVIPGANVTIKGKLVKTLPLPLTRTVTTLFRECLPEL